MTTKTVSIKLNRSLNKNPAGAIVRVRSGPDGKPVDRYWRDRLKDAATDNCCEIVKPETKQKKVREDG